MSEPAIASAAQQELRPPNTWATDLGRARLCPSRQSPSRLGELALPIPGQPSKKAEQAHATDFTAKPGETRDPCDILMKKPE